MSVNDKSVHTAQTIQSSACRDVAMSEGDDVSLGSEQMADDVDRFQMDMEESDYTSSDNEEKPSMNRTVKGKSPAAQGSPDLEANPNYATPKVQPAKLLDVESDSDDRDAPSLQDDQEIEADSEETISDDLEREGSGDVADTRKEEEGESIKREKEAAVATKASVKARGRE